MAFLLNSPAFVGIPTAPTAAAGTGTTQLATCAFVMNALAVPPYIGIGTPNAANFTALGAQRIGLTGVVAPGLAMGNIWIDSTQQNLMAMVGAVAAPVTVCASMVLYTHTGWTTGSAAGQNCLGFSGVGTLTLPAGFLVPGKTIRLTLSGVYSSGASSPGVLSVEIGGVSTNIVVPGLAPSSTNVPWSLTALFTCRTSGSTGTIWPHGGTAAVTLNTTVSNVVQLMYSSWQTGDSCTVNFALLEALN